MVDHLLELDELFDRLKAANLELQKELMVAMVLRSLPESYDNLVVALEARADDDITLKLVKQKLTDEYQKRVDQRGGASENRALRISSRKVEQKVCFYCKQPGHFRRECRKYLESRREDAESGMRQEKAHKKEEKVNQVYSSGAPLCFTATKYVGDTDKPSGISAACSIAGGRQRSWFVDSGATHHMTYDRSFFTTMVQSERVPVTLANGDRTMSEGCGSGMLRCVDADGKEVDVKLENVLWVPKLDSSLLSVSTIISKGFSVLFNDKGCTVLDHAGSAQVFAERCGGLYVLRTSGRSMAACAPKHSEFCQHTWHRRLGHRDSNAISRIMKEEMVTEMKIVDCGVRMVCECCLEGKLPRTAFPKKAEKRTTEVLELVHTDLCGPFRNVTPGGKKYFMTLIDDFSRYTVVYLLARKSEAVAKIKEFVRMVEQQFGRKPRTIRSDNGGEYCTKELDDFYRAEGIRAEYSTPYSPQQNGVAERRNRYIQEMALCMLLDAKLPKRFWGEAVTTAVFLQNRLSSRSIECTPFEKWFNRKPNLNILKVFGCEALVRTRGAKSSSKPKKLVFVGYDSETNGYRFLEKKTCKITINCDAEFLELGILSNINEFPEFDPHHQQPTEKVSDRIAVEIGTMKEDNVEDSEDEFYGFDDDSAEDDCEGFE